jgi:DNA polymerase-3 subunit alpha
MPIYSYDGKHNLTNYDKNDLEEIGLIKVDILGLYTLTTLGMLIEDIKETYGIIISLHEIPVDCKETFQYISTGHTCGIFQLESHGIQNFVKQFKPHSIEDLAVILSIYRPGPLESQMDKEICLRKSGEKEIEYFHESIKDILLETYGILTYQEQIMLVLQKLSGMSLGQADKVQRAITRKNNDEIKKSLEFFYKNCGQYGVSVELANQIGELIVKFGGYGFNKSHAVSYAFITYWTAYLKTHYPLLFYKNIFNHAIKDHKKLSLYLKEYEEKGYQIYPPHINKSKWYFSIENGYLVYGLGSIKGFNHSVSEKIIQSVEKDGHFKDIYDIHFRMLKDYNID